MKVLYIINQNLNIINKQSLFLRKKLNEYTKDKKYYLNLFESDFKKNVIDNQINFINIKNYKKEYNIDVCFIELYNKFIDYKKSLINRNNDEILLSIFLNKDYINDVKLYLELLHKIKCELDVDKIICYDLFIIECILNLIPIANNQLLNNILDLQNLIEFYLFDDINYFNELYFISEIFNFNNKYQNNYLKIVTNNNYLYNNYKDDIKNLKFKKIIFDNYYKSNNLINSHNIFKINDNKFKKKINNLNEFISLEKEFSYLLNSRTLNSESITVTIDLNYLYNLSDNCINFINNNKCGYSQYLDYLENELNYIITNSMTYINLIQKIIDKIFNFFINLFNKNKIYNKNIEVKFNFINKCFFNINNYSIHNIQILNNLSDNDSIKNKIKYGFNKINNNFINSYMNHLETLKLNLSLYCKIKDINIFSNMFYNKSNNNINFNNMNGDIDLEILCFNDNESIDKIDNYNFNF